MTRREGSKHSPFAAADFVDSIKFGTITGAGTGTMTIPMTFQNASGEASKLSAALGKVVAVEAWMTDDAAGQVLTTVNPSAIAADTAKGLVIPLGADNKQFMLVANSDGLMTLVISQTTGATHYLNLKLPDGRVVVSAALAF